MIYSNSLNTLYVVKLPTRFLLVVESPMVLSQTNHLNLSTELIDQIVSDVFSYGKRDYMDTCALLCKQWHAVTLRYTFRRVSFILYDESDLILFRRIIDLYPWLPPFVHEATLKFRSWEGEGFRSDSACLGPVLDALPQLVPHLQALIFDGAHGRHHWNCNSLSPHLRGLSSLHSLKFRFCSLRLMDFKMFLRAFPNLRQLHASATLLSGDSTVGITPDEMPTLSCLRLTFKVSSKTFAARMIPRKFYKFVTDSLAVNGISCLSINAHVDANGAIDDAVGELIRTLGPSVRYLRWFGSENWPSNLELNCECLSTPNAIMPTSRYCSPPKRPDRLVHPHSIAHGRHIRPK